MVCYAFAWSVVVVEVAVEEREQEMPSHQWQLGAGGAQTPVRPPPVSSASRMYH